MRAPARTRPALERSASSSSATVRLTPAEHTALAAACARLAREGRVTLNPNELAPFLNRLAELATRPGFVGSLPALAHSEPMPWDIFRSVAANEWERYGRAPSWLTGLAIEMVPWSPSFCTTMSAVILEVGPGLSDPVSRRGALGVAADMPWPGDAEPLRPITAAAHARWVARRILEDPDEDVRASIFGIHGGETQGAEAAIVALCWRQLTTETRPAVAAACLQRIGRYARPSMQTHGPRLWSSMWLSTERRARPWQLRALEAALTRFQDDRTLTAELLVTLGDTSGDGTVAVGTKALRRELGMDGPSQAARLPVSEEPEAPAPDAMRALHGRSLPAAEYPWHAVVLQALRTLPDDVLAPAWWGALDSESPMTQAVAAQGFVRSNYVGDPEAPGLPPGVTQAVLLDRLAAVAPTLVAGEFDVPWVDAFWDERGHPVLWEAALEGLRRHPEWLSTYLGTVCGVLRQDVMEAFLQRGRPLTMSRREALLDAARHLANATPADAEHEDPSEVLSLSPAHLRTMLKDADARIRALGISLAHLVVTPPTPAKPERARSATHPAVTPAPKKRRTP
jgi:hypothetical protein